MARPSVQNQNTVIIYNNYLSHKLSPFSSLSSSFPAHAHLIRPSSNANVPIKKQKRP